MNKQGIDVIEEFAKLSRRMMSDDYSNKLEDTFDAVEDEISRAKEKYKQNFNSYHEGYAVILEEIDEFWDEIKKKEHDKVKMKEEAIQCMAMLGRFVVELL